MMNVTDYTNIKTLLVKFKEKSDVLYAKAAALSNYATIEWVDTQIPSVGNGTVTIKQNGTSKGSFSMNQSGGATINLTDTTYSSLSAVSGGTDKSLVTTGEKYTWNNKWDYNATTIAGVKVNNAVAADKAPWSGITDKPTTLSGYGITDASRIFRYTIPASGNKGVRITFTSGEPVKITVSGANQGAQLVLIGTGYGEGGFVRNNFTEVVPSDGAYTWCVSNDYSRSVEIFSKRSDQDFVTVESPSLVTFTAISALSTDAAYRHLLTSENYSKWALPLTGGNITGSIRMNGHADVSPLIRNYTRSTGGTGEWARNIIEGRVDDKIGFHVSTFGTYTPGAENNKATYAYIGFAGYNGLNLRISDTSLTWGDDAIYHAGNANNLSTDWTCKSLVAAGDIKTSGWCKATNGFFIEKSGVYYTHHSQFGEIDIVRGNEFIWGSQTDTLYFNYRPSANKTTTVTHYVWNAGSPTTYATHTMGTLTVLGAITATTTIYAKTGIYTDGYISAKQASTSSDRRLKKDFCKIDNALKYVLKTHYTRFRWKDDNKESIGIIAQEEQNREYGFLVQNNEKIGHLTYDYAASTALLGAAIQEEDSKVEKLKKRVAELEKELSNLKRKWQH